MRTPPVLTSRMRLSDSVREAVGTVGQRPARAFLTALGTLLGVGAFVATTGLAATARAQVSARFDALKATEVRVEDVQPDGTNPFPIDAGARLGRLNGVRSAGLLYRVDGSALFPRTTPGPPGANAQFPTIMAAAPGALSAALASVETGRMYDDFHEERGERVAILGPGAAETLGLTRIDNHPAVFIGDTAFTVIGVLDTVAREPDMLDAVIVPVSAARSVLAAEPTDAQVLIDTQPGAAALIGRQAPVALRPEDPTRLRSLVPPDPDTLRGAIESDVTALYYALAGLALLIGTVAIANATLLNTIERRPEIGLRRALGARKRHIARQITLEAMLIGALGGVAGTSVAICTLAGYCRVRGWSMTLEPATTLSAPVIGLLTGAIAGAIPAVRAARTAPATTLRS